MRKISIYILTVLTLISMLFCFACSCSDKPSTEPPKPPTQTAVSDLNIDTNGVLTFSEDAGETYTLLINGMTACKIKSGDDVTALIGTEKTELSVIKDARNGYAKSEPSNKVIAKKAEDIQLSVTDLALGFNADSGIQYDLVVVGKALKDVFATNGMNISEYVRYGANEIYVSSGGAVLQDGTVELKNRSNSVNLYLHEKVDAKITANGTINFTEQNGYTYSFTYNEQQLPVTNQTDITEILNSMVAGNNPVEISVTGSTEENNVYCVLDADKTTQFNVKRYAKPTNVNVTNTNRIVFDGETRVVNLYVNDTYKGEVYYGENIYRYFTGKNNQIKLVADSDGFGWKSEKSEAVSVNLDKHLSASFKMDTPNTLVTQTAQGVSVMGNAGTVITYSEKISLKDIAQTDYLIQMKPIFSGSSFGLQEVTLKLVDAYDSSKGLELKMANGTGYNDATNYGGGKLGGVDSYSSNKSAYTAVTNNLANYLNDTSDIRIKYNVDDGYFTVELSNATDYQLKSDNGLAENENPFSENNENLDVYLTIEYVVANWDSGFIFESIAGNKFSVDKEDWINFDNENDWIWGEVVD